MRVLVQAELVGAPNRHENDIKSSGRPPADEDPNHPRRKADLLANL